MKRHMMQLDSLVQYARFGTDILHHRRRVSACEYDTVDKRLTLCPLTHESGAESVPCASAIDYLDVLIHTGFYDSLAVTSTDAVRTVADYNHRYIFTTVNDKLFHALAFDDLLHFIFVDGKDFDVFK